MSGVTVAMVHRTSTSERTRSPSFRRSLSTGSTASGGPGPPDPKHWYHHYLGAEKVRHFECRTTGQFALILTTATILRGSYAPCFLYLKWGVARRAAEERGSCAPGARLGRHW
jgi:hypothetical protein